jgi:hypothetical protein
MLIIIGSQTSRFRGRRNTPTPGRVEAQSHATPSTSEDVPPYEKAQNEEASSASKLGEAPPYSLPDDQSVSVTIPTAQLSSSDVEKHDCHELTESSLEATNVQSISYSVSASDAASIHGEKQERSENMQVRWSMIESRSWMVQYVSQALWISGDARKLMYIATV